MNDQNPENQELNDDPGERLRRLMSSENNEEESDLSTDENGQTLPLSIDDEEQDVNSTAALSRHPTGQPEETGGWYGQADETPDESTRANLPSRPAEDIEQTRPVLPSDPNQTRVSSGQPITRPSGRPTPSGPLPRRVEEVDMQATRVTPAAYQPGSGSAQRPYSNTTQQPYAGAPGYRPAAGGRPPAPPAGRVKTRGSTWGCLARGLVGLLFAGVVGAILLLSIAVIQYFAIAAGLPSVDDLRARASQFETTRILDRNGNNLYEIIDPNAGKRTYVPLDSIDPDVVAATIATEDKDFYTHPGFDPVAIFRAMIDNYTTGGQGGGASTITQQLARNLLLSPEERTQRTAQRKMREIVLAAEITRQYTKEEILELYLNENFYGKNAYGIEAAAETYFNTTAGNLTLSQAAFLAGLPQSPGVYDIDTNRPATLERFRQVLVLMYQLSSERQCIFVSNSTERVCVDEIMAAQAVDEMVNYQYQAPTNTIRFPHWVDYIRAQLEAQFDPQTIYRSGFTVFTTLDPTLQEQAQQVVSEQVGSLADRHVTDGALVAIRPATGEILAMVGSADFYNDAIAGQVNMAVQPRQPGSAIKPLTYVAAFEKGWTPATLIWDVPSGFPPSGDPNDPREPYRPVNYDGRFRGPVTVRTALANSLNIPAVKTLQFVGIYDNPSTAERDGLVPFAERLGITTLTRNDYGLSLTLGGGDVTLLQLTSAFSTFANQGKRIAPVAITRIVDHEGNLVYDYQVPAGEQVVRPEHAFLISSILSDNAARTPTFGENSVLNLPFQAAAKTGTTNDFRDNWTVGYTPDLAVGVWVGNADYTPMVNTTGLTGAAPIWSSFMQAAVPAVTNGSPSTFKMPAGVVEKVICETSGSEPSEWCPSQRVEFFAADQPPQPKEQDLWQRAMLDTWTNLRASAACSNFTTEEQVLSVQDKDAREWILDTDEGRAWAASLGFNDKVHFAPERECTMDDSRPTIIFANLQDEQTVNDGMLDIYAVVNATTDFRQYRLEYGEGSDPHNWTLLREGITEQSKDPTLIHTWDLKDVPSGIVTLRIYLESTRNTYAEHRIHLNMQVPTATPTVTPTSTNTPQPTSTSAPLPTVTPQPPTNTPEVSPTAD